ncbi:MAG: DUF4397 domain-containing protein [Bacteroidetes bacterium]|nr:MAG: DUF4397 domain-containing protein [Bacteroidota bacterium]
MRKLILTLAAGFFLALTPGTGYAQTALVQIIHNSPDPLAATVDIYINGGAIPAVDNLDFREATAFLSVPTNVIVGIALGNSTGPGSILATFPYTLVANQKYVIVANGLLNTTGYNTTVNSPITFSLNVITPAQDNAPAGSTSIVAFHGSTDAPQVDVLANGNTAAPLINNLSYGNNSGYATVPAAKYVLQVTPGNNNSTVVATYYADLTPLSGGAAVIFASGFLNPATNQNGAAFGLFAALPNGTVLQLTSVGTARAQVIHNAADPAAATVDIYINTLTDTLKLDNVPFRGATGFIDLPSGYPVDVVIALPTSTGIANGVVATFPITATTGEKYHIVANGVLTPGSFAANPSAVNTAFTLLVQPGAQESAAAGSVALKVLHGSTDAPAVGVNANGNQLIPSFQYKDFVGYVNVPAGKYRVDVTGANAPGTVIAPFYADLSGLGGGASLVFASGFLTPSANQNGPAFGLFAALPNGTVVALTPVSTARAQVIHNAADPAAATVDIYINTLTDTLKLDNVPFRGATGFIDLPAGYPVDVVVALPTSTGISNGALATFPITAAAGEKYHIVANGVLTPGSFAVNPNAVNTAFTLLVQPGALEAGTAGNVSLKVLHGSTDAPAVGVNANGNQLIPSFQYKDFVGYVSVPAAEYRVDVTGANAPGTVIAPFYADLSGLGGGASLVFASGFLTPSANQSGPAFGLFAALPNGTVLPLTPVGNARAQVIHNAADPAAATVDIYINTLTDTVKLDNFAFRTATPFIDLPSGYPVKVVVALPSSTGIGNGALATFPITAATGQKYHIIANGVLNPASFAANPGAVSTAFNLFIGAGAREESATAGQVDLKVFHGATDAPRVDVLANGGTPALITDLGYTEFEGYATVPPANYTLSITPAGNNSTVVAAFIAPASSLADSAGLILATGFLTPANNQNGAGFGLLLVLPDGKAILLATSSIDELPFDNELLNAFPNPVSEQLSLEYTVKSAGNVRLRVFDAQGRLVVDQQQGKQSPGEYSLDLSAASLAAGVHTVVLETETARAVRRITVLH